MSNSKTLYAATHIHKEVAEDKYDEGEVTERACTLHEPIDFRAENLADLITKIGDEYGLRIDEVFVPDDPVVYFDFDQYEDDECNPVNLSPGTRDHERFHAGRLRVWHAIYSFMVEKRTVEHPGKTEFERAGIKIRG